MTRALSLYVVVEDILSEAVMSRLLGHIGYEGHATYVVTRGNGQIRNNMEKYKAASRVIPHIVLTDLDRYSCPPTLLDAWGIGTLPTTLLLRVAVREVEAWLMSDRKNLAAFLSSAVTRLPVYPEKETDPKITLFNVIRKTRKRRLIDEMVPQPGAHIGPLYNERMCEFVRNHWQVEIAKENAPSLARTHRRISTFLKG
jgi:hypothetical protein